MARRGPFENPREAQGSVGDVHRSGCQKIAFVHNGNEESQGPGDVPYGATPEATSYGIGSERKVPS